MDELHSWLLAAAKNVDTGSGRAKAIDFGGDANDGDSRLAFGQHHSQLSPLK